MQTAQVVGQYAYRPGSNAYYPSQHLARNMCYVYIYCVMVDDGTLYNQ